MPAQTRAQHPFPFDVRPLTPNLGAEMSASTSRAAWTTRCSARSTRPSCSTRCCCSARRTCRRDGQVEFARHFGEVQIHVMNQYHADGHPELYRLSNLDENGNPNGKHPDKGTLAWHTDGSWRRVTGQATIIYGEVVAAKAARRTSATCTAPTSA